MVYWSLVQIERYGALYADGLRIIQAEGRFPVRVYSAITKLQLDARHFWELWKQELEEEQTVPGSGFVGLLSLYHDRLDNALIDIIGHQCTRLRAWVDLNDGLVASIFDRAPSGHFPSLEVRRVVAVAEGRLFPLPGTWDGGLTFEASPSASPEEAAKAVFKSGAVEMIDLTLEDSLDREIKRTARLLGHVQSLRVQLGAIIQANYKMTDML